MIERTDPATWRDLQNGVCQIFREIGLTAETEVQLSTPRGTVEVDVYGIDENSVDQIKYVVECKNWESAIPQSVVHSFTTVMSETGANIGFIVSKKGLQSGAENYTDSTNIVGLTFLQFQERYLNAWWKRHFCPRVAEAAESLHDYVEPINSRRSRFVEKLSESQLAKLRELIERYSVLGNVMWLFDIGSLAPQYATDAPSDFDEFKEKLNRDMSNGIPFTSNCFRDLLGELSERLIAGASEFHELFGCDIFKT